MAARLDARRSRVLKSIFYGWKIVATAFLTLFISVGFSFYSFGPFFKALAAELGGSRLGVGLGLSVFMITNGLAAPWIGRSLVRGPIRSVMTRGVLLMVAGFLLVSRVQALWQFYVVLATLLALGAASMGPLVAQTLVAGWFIRRRGMALGVATMGISLSGMVMAPVSTLLIERLGWRLTFVVYAVLTLVLVLPGVRLFVVNQPEDLGLSPDGDSADDPLHGTRPLERPPVTTAAALGSRNFWVIAVTIALNFCGNSAILTHIVPHATDLGYSPPKAALILSMIAGVGVVGKVLFGWLSDHVSGRIALWIATALQGTALFIFLQANSYGVLLFGGAVFGLGMGGIVPLWGTLIGTLFGRRSFGQVMGLMSPFMLPFQTLGVPFAGYVFDRTGSYEPAFRVLLFVYGLAFAVLALLRRTDN